MTRLVDPAPTFLNPGNYEAIADLMVNRSAVDDGFYVRPTERSFAGNMRVMREEADPEVFLFTHKSSIPLADSVRGYYEELGLPVPDFGIINTKDIEGFDKTSEGASAEVFEREVPKITGLVQGCRVAVLDQFLFSLATISRASHIAAEAGAVQVVRPDSARWYHDAELADIDFEDISSVHRERMRAIGRASARVSASVGKA